MSAARNPTIDVAKGLGILLVVFGHTDDIIPDQARLVYSFHIPLFFILSGTVFDEEKYLAMPFARFVGRKLRQLYVPVLAMAAACGVLSVAVGDTVGVREFAMKFIASIYGMASAERTFRCGTLWFLPCLLLVHLLYYAVAVRWPSCRAYLIAGIFLVGLAMSRYLPSLWYPLCVDRALVALPFFAAGVALRRQPFFSAPLLPLPVVILALPCVCYVSTNNPQVVFGVNSFGDPFSLLFCSFFGSLCVLRAAQALRTSRLFGFLGRHTLPLFGFDLWLHAAALAALAPVGLDHWVAVVPTVLALGAVMIWAGGRAKAFLRWSHPYSTTAQAEPL